MRLGSGISTCPAQEVVLCQMYPPPSEAHIALECEEDEFEHTGVTHAAHRLSLMLSTKEPVGFSTRCIPAARSTNHGTWSSGRMPPQVWERASAWGGDVTIRSTKSAGIRCMTSGQSP